jgi:Protein of unknown function (DUF732)
MVAKSPTAWAVSLIAAALLTAAPANADATDDAFIAALTSNGITVSDRDSATAMAQAICDGFDHHQRPSLLAMKLMKQSGLSLKQSSYFVGAAISSYCPEYSQTPATPAAS